MSKDPSDGTVVIMRVSNGLAQWLSVTNTVTGSGLHTELTWGGDIDGTDGLRQVIRFADERSAQFMLDYIRYLNPYMVVDASVWPVSGDGPEGF